jgi:oligosaccharide repeat unit polymerase
MHPNKRLSVNLAFLGFFCFYNLMGLIDTPWTYPNQYNKKGAWLLFLVFLCCYVFGMVFFNRFGINLRIKKSSVSLRFLGFVFFSLFLFCVLFTLKSFGGIPIFMGESRFFISTLIFNISQIYGFWVAYLNISNLENGIKIPYLQILIYIFGMILFGYRSPVIILALIFSFYFVFFKISRRRAIVLGGVGGGLILLLSSFASGYRVNQDYNPIDFFDNINFDYFNGQYNSFVPALSMFDFSQKTVSKIYDSPDTPKHGEIFISNYKAFLPGTHWGARNIIGDLTGARWINDRPMSITPTLQGAIYADFSTIGVGIFAFFLPLFFSIFYSLSLKNGAGFKLFFCYFLTLSILSIHNGYWDITFLFYLLFCFILSIFYLLKIKK